ncbi:MAG: Gmad2 immunoglobulin-like domain-containing protein [Patescibacteria group bacterium]
MKFPIWLIPIIAMAILLPLFNRQGAQLSPKRKKVVVVLLILGIVVFAGLVYTFILSKPTTEVNTENEVISSKEVFYTPDEAREMISVEFPVAGGTISSPLTITGQARGYWFFEATAPVVLVNWDGLIIAEGYIEAEGDWMTEEYVPFEGTIEFQKPDYGENGALIIQRSNPSDLRRNDAAVEVPIRFN